MTIEQKEKADKINWWHTIKLSDDYTTKGRIGLDHCSSDVITNRFGMPENLKGKIVLDVGGWDGLFAFEAEKRGADSVYMIDCFQNKNENADGFLFAREVLESKVFFDRCNLEQLSNITTENAYDIVLYYGLLYHVENPIVELKCLYKLCKNVAIIETAIAQNDYGNKPVWEYNYGFEGDSTNYWYCSLAGLASVLRYVGFKQVELIWQDGIRSTVKCYK